MKKVLKVPKFKNEDQEREFWDKTDFGDYFEAKDFVRASFPNLKPTSKAISLRMPQTILWDIKQRANSIDIPYQALMKKYISDGIRRDSLLSKK